MTSVVSITAILSLVVLRGAHPFTITSRSSMTHQDITMAAILQETADVCQTLAQQQGLNFVLPNPLTVETLAEACSSPESAKSFRDAINDIRNRNVFVDFRHVFDEEYHFDDESFIRGRDLITAGVAAVMASIQQERFETARERLGETLHTLQDFYSHSNWIELNNTSPYINLIRPDSPIDNIADQGTPTCRSCVDGNCENNILESILRERKLTSGYFSLTESSKPEGKCSHGGSVDRTSRTEPIGGINKDGVDSDHGHLHQQAAEVATLATRELLQDIRGAFGDSSFLRLMRISQTFSVLCFVIDTSVSMIDDITEVRRITSSIIDSKMGSSDEPSDYILVPFNDPEFGPLMTTTSADEFRGLIDALSPSGGGDDSAEMSLSGLWLALAGAPPRSEIFLFTDAEAKDVELRSTVLALIERTKSTVNFILTNGLSLRPSLSNPINQPYLELAQVSGGQLIEITTPMLPQLTSVILDTLSSTLVTLFQAIRNPPTAETFMVPVDSSVSNLTFYISGNSLTFTITSPTGNSQTNDESSGILGQIQTVGNNRVLRVNNNQNQTGQWQISINATQAYSIRVIGLSNIDVLFDIVEVFQVPNPGFTIIEGRPAAGGNVSLLVSLATSGSVRLTEVALVDTVGSREVNGTFEDQGNGDYLVTVTNPPTGTFGIRAMGEATSTRSPHIAIQRFSSTQFRTSNITVTALANGSLAPGVTFSLPFTVENNGVGGNFIITARNDRRFESSFPNSLTLGSGGSANGTVTLTAPADTPSGTDVTLTIEAEAPGGADFNYMVLRLSVVSGGGLPVFLSYYLWLCVVGLSLSQAL